MLLNWLNGITLKIPLGNQAEHFDTVEEAQIYADELNQKYRDAYRGFKEKLKKID